MVFQIRVIFLLQTVTFRYILGCMDNKRRSYWLLVIAMFAWGSLYPVSKYMMAGLHPLLLSLFRYTVSAGLLLPFFIREQQKYRYGFKPRDWITFAGLSGLGVTAFAVFLFYGIHYSTAAAGSVLANTQPLFTAVLAPFLIGETLSGQQIGGLIIGLVGVFLVVTGGQTALFSVHNATLTGNILLLGAALSMSLYSILLKRQIKRYGGLVPTFLTMLLGAAGLAIAAGLTVNAEWSAVKDLALREWLLILYLGGAATALPYLLFNHSLKYLDVIKATGYKFLIPATGVLLSILLLKERPQALSFLGMGLVLIAMLFVQKLWRPRKFDI